MNIVVVVQSDSNLLQMVSALRPASGFPSLLHGGKQQRHQNSNDGDHNEQLDQGEGTPAEGALHGTPRNVLPGKRQTSRAVVLDPEYDGNLISIKYQTDGPQKLQTLSLD